MSIRGKVGLTIQHGRDRGKRLELIRGTYPRKIQMGSLTIVASLEKDPPFRVDAMAVEEDTFLVMSADRRVRDPKEPLIKVMTRVINSQPKTPGSVIVQERSPLRLLAIVHDLNEEPSWREEWVARALEGIFSEAEARNLRSIAIPFLGTVHGSMEKRRFMLHLRSTIERFTLHHLKRLWLVAPPGINPKLFEVLEDYESSVSSDSDSGRSS